MSDHLKVLSPEKIAKYLDTTRRARNKIKFVSPDPSWLARIGNDYLRMADSYQSDAETFAEAGDFVNAFACINYSHAWLDAGARLGLWDVEKDDVLFTLLE